MQWQWIYDCKSNSFNYLSLRSSDMKSDFSTKRDDNLTLLFIFVIVFLVVASLGCFVMSIVFSYVPRLVYPHPIVNVKNVTHQTTGISHVQFYMRCDISKHGPSQSQLLQDCGAITFAVDPDCNLNSWQSYWASTYGFGEMQCPTLYLQEISATENLSVNLVALASAMMMIGGFVLLIPFWCICQ